MNDAEQWWFLFGYSAENKRFQTLTLKTNRVKGNLAGYIRALWAGGNSCLSRFNLLRELLVNNLHDNLCNLAVK